MRTPLLYDTIATTARTYLGVRFVHQGRSIQGVDCLGLLMLVAQELGLCGRSGQPFTKLDDLAYSSYPQAKQLHTTLARELTPIHTPEAGAILLFQWDGVARHLGICTKLDGAYGLLHAYAPAGKVVEHRLDASWQTRLCGIYQLAIPRVESIPRQ